MKALAVITSFISLAAAPAVLYALEFVSVAEPSAILYDAPSVKAKKLFVVSRYLPLEQVVSLNNWVKVRDSSGSLAWVEKRILSNQRFVVVTVPIAAIRQAAEDSAPLAFQAQQQVALEWLENTGTGWLKVRHQDGTMGFVSKHDVWGD